MSTTTRELRRHERYPLELDVEVAWEGHGTAIGTTRDMSDGGVLLALDFQDGETPPVDTEVSTRLIVPPDAEQPPAIRARVARHTPQGIALEFIVEG